MAMVNYKISQHLAEATYENQKNNQNTEDQIKSTNLLMKKHQMSTLLFVIMPIRQIPEKKCENNEAVYQLLIDFKKAYDLVRRKLLYNILIEFGITMKLVRLVKMCLDETYSRVQVGKHLSDMFPIKNGLKQGGNLSPMLFNFALEYAIRRIQVNQEGLILIDTHQLLVYADDVNILGRSIHTIKKNAEALVIAGKETRLEVNADKLKYKVMS